MSEDMNGNASFQAKGRSIEKHINEGMQVDNGGKRGRGEEALRLCVGGEKEPRMNADDTKYG